MKTNTLRGLVMMLPCLLLGCGTAEQSTAAAPEPPTAAPKARMNLLQLMRAFPFPHSNVVFDTQGRDPVGPEKLQSMAFSVYRYNDSDAYAGWTGVENSALALAEIAPLLLTPRPCSNGNPAPVDREDWKAAVQGLVQAGEEAYKAALTKNLDTMVDTSGTLSNACAACHDIYRDVDLTGGERCAIPKS
jgi:hypothetical protein